MAERCEWAPEKNDASEWRPDGTELPGNCPNAATEVVGTGLNNWHLCASCAALPRFKRMKKVHRGERGPNAD